MEIIISLAFGLRIGITALVYRAICSRDKRGGKDV